VKIDLALRAPRARRQGASRCSATFGSLSARASSTRAEPLLRIAHYAELRIQKYQQVISSQWCAPRGRLHTGASQPEVEITEGDPMAEI
jgi:hypothetical protein